jgi:hypothetical protein
VPDVKVELVDSRIMNQLSYEVLCDRFKALGFDFQGSLDDAVRQTATMLPHVRAGAASQDGRRT